MAASNETEESPFFRALLALCAFASIAPLFASRYLPFTDLPEHVATMATLRHWFDPAWNAQTYFELTGFGKTQYWLYHLAGALLTAVTGSAERANLVLLGGIGIAYPYSLRALLRALGRDTRLALFGCALFFTQNLTIGLLNFVASVPVVLYALALVVRQAESPTRRRFYGLAALSVALLYLHLSSYMLFAVDAALLMWLLPKSRVLETPRRLLWLAPSLACTALLMLGGRIGGGSLHGQKIAYLPRLDLIARVPHWLFDNFRTKTDNVLGWLLILTLVGLLAASPRARDLAERWRFRMAAMLFIVSFVVMLATPSFAGSYAGLLDIRMSIFVALFATLLPKPRLDGFGRMPLAFAGALALLLSLNAWSEIRAFERDEVGNFDELLRQMPHGKRLLSLNFDQRSTHVNVQPFNFFGSYYRSRYGGVASFSFNEVPHWPVQYRDDAMPPHAADHGDHLSWGNPCIFNNGKDGEYYDYVLVHGERDPIALGPAGPAWELIGSSRAFHLYRRLPGDRRDGVDTSLCT